MENFCWCFEIWSPEHSHATFGRSMSYSQSNEDALVSGVSAANAIQTERYRWQFRFNSNLKDEIEDCELLAKAMEIPAAVKLARISRARVHHLHGQDGMRAGRRLRPFVLCAVPPEMGQRKRNLSRLPQAYGRGTGTSRRQKTVSPNGGTR